MKKYQSALFCLLVMLTALTAARAGFRLPTGVYRLSELEAAREKAGTWKKPITFVYTDEDTTCPLCEAASLDAMKSLKYRTVVVYAHAGSDWQQLPSPVKTALNSSAAGRYIPKTVIIDPDFQNVIAVIPYSGDRRERSKMFREALQQISR